MGMFDYVNFKTPCPTCGTLLMDFQSKDLGCDMVMREPDELIHFYDSCHTCGTWVEFYRDYPEHERREVPLTEDEVLALGFKKHVRQKRASPSAALESIQEKP
jgi:hypothetical protein